MALLTELQMRCVSILQRRVSIHGEARTHSIAWELGKTDKQAADCLNRLLRKGLVTHVGLSLWGLTQLGKDYKPALPPGE
jgi:Mn-dependent DtxR family transcriptional regulator